MLNTVLHGGFLKGYKTLIGAATVILGVLLPWAYGEVSLAEVFTAENIKVIGGALAAWGIGSKLAKIEAK
jgi:hypothetical protein